MWCYSLSDVAEVVRWYTDIHEHLADEHRIPTRCEFKMIHIADELDYWEERRKWFMAFGSSTRYFPWEIHYSIFRGGGFGPELPPICCAIASVTNLLSPQNSLKSLFYVLFFPHSFRFGIHNGCVTTWPDDQNSRTFEGSWVCVRNAVRQN